MYMPFMKKEKAVEKNDAQKKGKSASARESSTETPSKQKMSGAAKASAAENTRGSIFGVEKNKVDTELAAGERVSIINLVNSIIEHAYAFRSSDVHMDPVTEAMRVRFRIDGVMQDVHTIPSAHQAEVISRIKILAGLRTDEHQAAQDGRFRMKVDGGETIDVRVSVMPTYYGENVVMRLLADQAEEYTLESLGFSKENQQKIMRAMKRPYGMILATGPTGSGKTTTLYTILKQLNTKDVSIITIEDPIEYAVPGIEQIQVKPRTSLTFANGLRSILRQDPDIIMVGEIRDAETAGIAVNTALTGHLVLSTLHTNDAATTLPRLLDMKIEPYLIASTVNIAIGQRLVRKICKQCKQELRMTEAELNSLNTMVPKNFFKIGTSIFRGKGCEACNHTGYFGRIGIHEVLVPDGAIRDAVLNKAQASEIQRLAVAQGMTTIVDDGLLKVKAGQTTLEEILRMHYE